MPFRKLEADRHFDALELNRKQTNPLILSILFILSKKTRRRHPVDPVHPVQKNSSSSSCPNRMPAVPRASPLCSVSSATSVAINSKSSFRSARGPKQTNRLEAGGGRKSPQTRGRKLTLHADANF